MESGYGLGGMDRVMHDPAVVSDVVTFLFHQVLQAVAGETAVQDLFKLILFITIYENWQRWGSCVAAGDRIWWCKGQLDHGKHGVKAF